MSIAETTDNTATCANASSIGPTDQQRRSCEPIHRRRRYDSDPSDSAWVRIDEFIAPNHPRGGRPRPPQRWRESLDAIGVLAAHRLRVTARPQAGGTPNRTTSPSAAAVDPSSVKASPVAGPRGFDGAKKVDGGKRHVLVDSAGMLVTALVAEANVQDRAAFPKLLCRAKRVAPTIAHVWLDKGYTGAVVA